MKDLLGNVVAVVSEKLQKQIGTILQRANLPEAAYFTTYDPALSTIKQVKPTFLFLDWSLVSASRHALFLQRLRKNKVGKDIFVTIITATVDDQLTAMAAEYNVRRIVDEGQFTQEGQKILESIAAENLWMRRIPMCRPWKKHGKTAALQRLKWPLMAASTFIEIIEKRQGMKIGCPEEVAFRMGLIDAHELEEIAKPLEKNSYGQYLLRIAKQGQFHV
jgi:hypothetical protein